MEYWSVEEAAFLAEVVAAVVEVEASLPLLVEGVVEVAVVAA